MTRLVFVVMVAACGGKAAAPVEPANTAAAPAEPVAADPECMTNCATEGPMDESGHFVYGPENEQSWTDVPATQQQSECSASCAN